MTIETSFLEALADLDGADAKRAASFLAKLVRSLDAPAIRPEIVHDAADRSIRSFKVTHDLRAVARVDGGEIALLFVARHDRAYAWARDRCLSCHPIEAPATIVHDSSGDDVRS